MPPKRERDSSESETPKMRRSLPSRISRPVRAAMRDGSEEDDVINEVTTTPLEKVIKESLRTAKKDLGLRSDEDLPQQYLGSHIPASEETIKRKRGRPRKYPRPDEDDAPCTSKTIRREALLSDEAATEADTESDGSVHVRPKKRRMTKKRGETVVRSPDFKDLLRSVSGGEELTRQAVAEPEIVVRKRGRPPKPKCENSENGKEEVKAKSDAVTKKPKSVTIEKESSEVSEEEHVYPRRNLPQKNYDQVKRRMKRRAETDFDASSGFDSDRGSLPNMRASRKQERGNKVKSHDTEAFMPVLNAVSPIEKNLTEVLKSFSPAESRPTLGKSENLAEEQPPSEHQTSPSKPKRGRPPKLVKDTVPDTNVATPPEPSSKSPERSCYSDDNILQKRTTRNFAKRRSAAGNVSPQSDSPDAGERIRARRSGPPVNYSMVKRRSKSDAPQKEASTSESDEEETVPAKRTAPTSEPKKESSKKPDTTGKVHKAPFEKISPAKRRSLLDWKSSTTEQTVAKKNIDESSSDEEIIPRTTKSRAVPLPAKKKESSSSPTSSIPPPRKRGRPRKGVKEETEESSSSTPEERIRSRRSLPNINYDQVKRRKMRRKAGEEVKKEKSSEEEEDEEEEEEIPRARRNLPQVNYKVTPSRRKRTEQKDSSPVQSEQSDDNEEESEEAERIQPRRSLPNVNYSDVQRRQKMKASSDEGQSESEDSSEVVRAKRILPIVNYSQTTPRKRAPVREESSSDKSDDSSEASDPVRARRSLPTVNYALTTPRKRPIPVDSSSDDDSDSEQQRTPQKSTGARKLPVRTKTGVFKSSEEEVEMKKTSGPKNRPRDSSDSSSSLSSEEGTSPRKPRWVLNRKSEPIFPQRISSESSESDNNQSNVIGKPNNKRIPVVKSQPRRPQCAVGQNNYFSSSESEDERFDSKILQQCQAMVKGTYLPIMAENDKAMEKEYEKFTEMVINLPPKVYSTCNGEEAEPTTLTKEEMEDDTVVSRVYTRNGQSVGPAAPVHYASTIPTYPRMKSWIYIEHNVRTEDSQKLSHIPYIDDEHDSVAFVRDLKKAYPEGIHGTRPGWGKHISDYLLYRLLKEAVPSWKETKNEMSYLYQTIYRLFPNKMSARQLEHIFPSLETRFEPNLNKTDQSKKDDIGHSIKTITCVKCLQYHCLLHGVSGEPFRMHRKPRTIPFPLNPCSDDCFLYLPEVEMEEHSSDDEDAPKIEKKHQKIKVRPFTEYQSMFNKLAQIDRHTPCQIAQMLAQFEVRSCSEVYYLMQTFSKHDREMSPDDITKRKLSMKEVQASFRHLTWNLGGGRVDNSEQPHACKHKGNCSRKNKDCVCARFETLCSKYCSCGVDCKMRFPGCRCQPGQCKTKQCQCFYAKWECDPDVCKSCNCGPNAADMKGPHMEFDLDDDEQEVKVEEDSEYLDCGEAKKKIEKEEESIPSCSNCNMQRGNYKRLKVGKSDIAGYGCFIDDVCEKGEFIAEYTGEVISKWEAERRGRIYDEYKTSYIFALNKEQSVDATRMGNHIRFANHSDKDANCYSQIIMVNGEHRIGIFAKRKLYPNEELLFDYQYNKKWKAQYCPNERNSKSELHRATSSPEPSTSKKLRR